MSSPLTVQRLSGTALGSLNIVQYTDFIITTTGTCTATLPDGYEGHQICIILAVDGGDLVVSGNFETTTGTSASATFADARDFLVLKWIANFGWLTVSNFGTVAFA